MFSLKNVMMIGLTGIIIALLIGVVADMPEYNFSVGSPENLTISENEWSEKGQFRENIDVSAEGWLELDKYSTAPQTGVYEATVTCDTASTHIPQHITLNASNIELTGEERKNILIQLVEFTPEIGTTTPETEVVKEYFAKNGENTYDFSDIRTLKNTYIRLELETFDAGQTPYVHDIHYEYTCLNQVDYGVKDFAELFVYFMIIVLIAGIGHHNKKVE